MRYLISNTTESKFRDVQIKTLSQICDGSNRFQAISTQLTSNLFTSTVGQGQPLTKNLRSCRANALEVRVLMDRLKYVK